MGRLVGLDPDPSSRLESAEEEGESYSMRVWNQLSHDTTILRHCKI